MKMKQTHKEYGQFVDNLAGNINSLNTYEIVENRWIGDLESAGIICRHKKTGAQIVLLSNDDKNKVFYIGFRTPPTDSTGVAHILEHSVLCGSKNFPAKDPFVELVKGSLNTFLNAMTYPDKTVYPVASCNQQDLQNLMHVYLDAVFYPKIYDEKKIFLQEGWHYDLESMEDELSMNGVVYNEMKGAFSSPDDVLDREVFNTLFPDTAYGVESGGDPDYIPDLTYEDFLEFHRKYYHPSNSYIYLYGDMDMVEKLKWIDENYLNHFEKIEIDSNIQRQKTFDTRKEISKEYSISEAESEKDNTYFAYNTVISDSMDPELYIAFQILDYAICSAPGAPIKQALIEKGIGKDVYSSYENGILQPYFSIVAKGANDEDKDSFVAIVEETLKTLIRDGIDKKSLMAGENFYEFRYREADFGSYPKGLMYGLQALDSWLYDPLKPFLHIEATKTFASMKEKIHTGYFEELIKTYLLENEHKSVIMVSPVKGLAAKKENELQKKLNELKESLSKEEISEIEKQTKELLKYQEEATPDEILEKIPLLNREDIEKSAEPFILRETKCDNTLLLRHDIHTNGIGYLRLLFDMKNIDRELLPYVGILKSVLGYIDTKHYKYGDLFNEINIYTGGITSQAVTYVNSKNLKEYRFMYEFKVSVLFENLTKAFELIEEILFSSKIEDDKRLQEIISEQKSRLQGDMTSAGHSLAAMRAMAYFSETAAIAEEIKGIPYYRLLEDLEQNFEQKKEPLIRNLKKLMAVIFRPENLMVDFTANEEAGSELADLVKDLKGKLYTEKMECNPFKIQCSVKNEGFTNSSKVLYVCRAGNFMKDDLVYTGALRVLRVIMGYDYLWNQVRVKGGAYGCMSNFSKTGDCYFVSYRDPNLEKTLSVYENAAEYIKEFSADERTMTKYIIGTVSDLDIPLNPSAKGSRSLSAYLSNVEFEEIQKERDEVLNTTSEIINTLASHVRTFIEDGCICVVGNEEKIMEKKELFEHTEPLFH